LADGGNPPTHVARDRPRTIKTRRIAELCDQTRGRQCAHPFDARDQFADLVLVDLPQRRRNGFLAGPTLSMPETKLKIELMRYEIPANLSLYCALRMGGQALPLPTCVVI
jgi:hypothetical protein